MTLLLHFEQDNWEALELAWTELMMGNAPVEPVLVLLGQAADKKLMPRCVPLVKDHAAALVAAGRHAEAAALLGRAMLGGGSPGEIFGDLYRAASAAWSAESWWAPFCEIAGLAENVSDSRTAWRAFDKLRNLAPGIAVFHGSGWGLGRVELVDLAALEAEVRFLSGRKDRIPMRSAIEIFDILEPSDLRARHVNDPEGLRRMLAQEPLVALEALLRRYNNRATVAVLRGACAQIQLDGPAFTAWWRKARKLAETSPWFEVTGTASKAQVRLLAAAADPTESLRRQLRLAPSLGAALTRARDLVSGARLEPALREAAIATVVELAAEESRPLSERLSAWLFLRDELGQTPAALDLLMRRAAAAPPPSDPAEIPALWRLFHAVPGTREQERCLELLSELFGADQWLGRAAEDLLHVPHGLVRPLIEALRAAGREEELARAYAALLARPTRNPHLLIGLAEQFEGGKLLSGELPGPLQRVQSLMHLASWLQSEAPGEPLLGRARTRLSDLLCRGRRPALRALLEDSDHTLLRNLRALAERGIDDPIESMLTDIIVEQAPQIFREEERPFWETGGVWTTRRGLERRRAELKEIREDKLVANAEAIGKAASFGDLSENSEWSSAIEEQRNLTQRARDIEKELTGARLLENAPLPDATIAPGTRVFYRDLGAGTEHSIAILGPWDLGGDDVVSYRAPLAAGLLGHRPGDRVRILLPSGEIEVEVSGIEPVRL